MAAPNALNFLYFMMDEAQTHMRCPHIYGKWQFHMMLFFPSRTRLRAYMQWAILAHWQKGVQDLFLPVAQIIDTPQQQCHFKQHLATGTYHQPCCTHLLNHLIQVLV